MNQRTKTLAIVFGAILGAGMLWQLLYPVWIEPIATLDQRLATRGEALSELEDLEKATQRAAEEYRALAARIGSFDVDRVTSQVRDRVNTLIDKHKLVADSVAPSRPLEDRKTKVWNTTINVKAVGRLESVIGFLKDVSELPQLARIGNVAIYPTSTNPGTKEAARVNLRVPIEIKVVPQQKLAGVIQEKDLHPPQAVVRNQSRDYSVLWTARSFFDYVPPAPLVAVAGKDAVVNEGQDAPLRGSATGGEPPYTFQWAGEGVNDPVSPNVVVNTKEFQPGEHVYVLTVTDAAGASATSTARVSIKAPPPARVAQEVRPPPPPPLPDPTWPQRHLMELVMMVGRSDAAESVDELMIQNKADGTLKYVKVGDDFDGGRLMYVHQTGGLVRRKDLSHPKEDRLYIYPIGAQLDECLTPDIAVDFPELQVAAMKMGATPPPVAAPGADAGGSDSPAGSANAAAHGSTPSVENAVQVPPAAGEERAPPATALGSPAATGPEGSKVEPARSGSTSRKPPTPPAGARGSSRRSRTPTAP